MFCLSTFFSFLLSIIIAYLPALGGVFQPVQPQRPWVLLLFTRLELEPVGGQRRRGKKKKIGIGPVFTRQSPFSFTCPLVAGMWQLNMLLLPMHR